MNRAYHTSQAHDKLLHLHLIRRTRKNTFSYYKSCTVTIKEFYFITVFLFSFKTNVVKESIMFTLLTCSTTYYMYSHTNLFDYMYLYYRLSSGAPTPRSYAQLSSLSFLTPHFIFNLVLRSRSSYHRTQRQKRLPDSHPDRYKDIDLFSEEPSCKLHSSRHDLLCTLDADNHLHYYDDASSLSISVLNNFSLAASLSPLDATAVCEYVNELEIFIRSAYFDCRRSSSPVTHFKRCSDNCDCIVKSNRGSHIWSFRQGSTTMYSVYLSLVF